jgi:Fic family protein
MKCRPYPAHSAHPFLDGNGRVARLLITLMFCHDKILRKPLLYPSLYFKQHRQQYYDELNAVRTDGGYERWIDFSPNRFVTAPQLQSRRATSDAMGLT